MGINLPSKKDNLVNDSSEGAHPLNGLWRILDTDAYKLRINPDIYNGPVETITIEEASAPEHKIYQRGDSAHDVATAVLNILTPSSEVIRKVVVVKGHTKMVKARREMDNSLFYASKGNKTTIPIAVIEGSQRDEAYILYLYDPDIRSVDRVAWPEGGTGVEARRDFLDKAAQIFARMHSQGTFHNDPQLKNFSIGKSTGEVSIFDFENCFFEREPRPIQEHIETIIHTFRVMFYSFFEGIDPKQHFWGELSMSNYERKFMDQLVKPYLRYLAEYGKYDDKIMHRISTSIDRAFEEGILKKK